MKITKRLFIHTIFIVLLAFVVAGWLILRSDALFPPGIADQILHNLFLAGGVVLCLSLVAAWLLGQAFTRPLTELRDVARALAQGDLSRRPALAAPGEVGDVAVALTGVSEQLGARLTALQNEDALLSALFDSLGEGVLALNRRLQIVEINAAGRRILNIADPVPIPVEHLPRERALHDALASALRGATTEALEITLGDRTLSITARPLTGGGTVLTVFELTQLRRLEAVRRDFAANVSHELRTPLTIVGGFAETLADAAAETDMSAEQRAHFASLILANTRRMQRIVDELLDLSRIESGGWLPRPTSFDIRDAVIDTLANCQEKTSKKELQLTSDLASDARTVYADRTALGQILSNLTENAIRHTAAGSVTIFSKLDPDRDGVWVGVRDTGMGIPSEHLPRIFERFYRADPGRAREAGGTGLGLAIVKHLIEAHGGEARAESAVGKGTTVSVWFPPPGSL